jgi:hypothetical protein
VEKAAENLSQMVERLVDLAVTTRAAGKTDSPVILDGRQCSHLALRDDYSRGERSTLSHSRDGSGYISVRLKQPAMTVSLAALIMPTESNASCV